MTSAGRFEALSALLEARRPLWEPRPFVHATLPWEREHPDVARWLRGLDEEAIDALERDPSAGDGPPRFKRWADECRPLTAIPRHPAGALPPRGERGVPARKQAQIEAFAGAALASFGPRVESVVDWCAGKGHLGRRLSQEARLPATMIEVRGDLCRAGEALSGPECRFIAGDVLAPDLSLDCLRPGTAAVALHACGHLTDALLRRAADRVDTIAAAMCCHHRLPRRGPYVPISEAGRSSGLTGIPLRLSTADEVVARPRRRASRRREMAWRLGADTLLREGSGVDEYRTLGRLSAAQIDLDFERFVRDASERLQTPLPASWSPARAEQRAWERARTARALAVVRGLYRRPVELWLVLDRALYLEERGRRTTVSEFCDAAVTPRNLLITSAAD